MPRDQHREFAPTASRHFSGDEPVGIWSASFNATTLIHDPCAQSRGGIALFAERKALADDEDPT